MAGLEIVRMERTSAISGEHRSYLATGAAGVPLRVLVFDRDLASIAPTPGGLGAVEVALSSGLAAAGMPGAAALSAVLLFRIATFWLPVPAGWVAVRVLRRRHAL